MSCYAIKTSKSKASVSSTISFRIYEVTRKKAVGCSSSASCFGPIQETSYAASFCRQRRTCNDITFVQSALPCNLLLYGIAFQSETWKQIFPSRPDAPDRPKDKKVNTNNIVIKQSNQINIKENGNFLDIEGDIAIKTEVPVPELSPINRVKNVGLFLTQNKTNNTPGFLAFKEMIQDLSSTLPEHYNTVISAPAEDPESPTPTPTPVPTPTPAVCDPVCIEVHSPEPRCQFGPISDCEVIERFSETVNIPQGMTPPVYVTMTGGADDLLMINGEVVEAGQYIGDRGCYVDGGNYSFVLEDTSFTIGAGDTIGYCSGYDYTICFSPCPPTGTT